MVEFIENEEWATISNALECRIEHYADLLLDPKRALSVKVAAFDVIKRNYNAYQKVLRIRQQIEGSKPEYAPQTDEIA